MAKKKYFRVVDGVKVNESNDFDKLQDECDAEMEGHVISASDFYYIRLEMIADLKDAGRLKDI